MRFTKSLQQKVVELGIAKINVDRLTMEITNAAYQCTNFGTDDDYHEFAVSHFDEQLESAKAYRSEHQEPYPEVLFVKGLIGCPGCIRAYQAMEDRKVAKRELSRKKGVVLKAAIKEAKSAVQS